MTPEQLLLLCDIRPTPVRLLIVRMLEKATAPLSALDIEKALDTVDRSSISRALALFSRTGLIHTIHDGSLSLKYELCPAPGSHSPSDHHVHFHCTECGRTICLDGLHIPELTLPPGFEAHGADCVISGLCPDCSKS